MKNKTKTASNTTALIRAIKRPAKLKKPKPTGKSYASVAAMTADLKKPKQAQSVKSDPVVAKSMWADPCIKEVSDDWAVIAEGHRADKCDPVPVKVLPADAASVERMVRQIALALDWEDGTGAGHENNATKVLIAVGISHPAVSKKFGITSAKGRK